MIINPRQKWALQGAELARVDPARFREVSALIDEILAHHGVSLVGEMPARIVAFGVDETIDAC